MTSTGNVGTPVSNLGAFTTEIGTAQHAAESSWAWKRLGLVEVSIQVLIAEVGIRAASAPGSNRRPLASFSSMAAMLN